MSALDELLAKKDERIAELETRVARLEKGLRNYIEWATDHRAEGHTHEPLDELIKQLSELLG